MAEAILVYARARNVRRIVIGRPRPRPFWARLTSEDVATDVLRRSGPFEVTIASEPDEKPRMPRVRLPALGAEPRAWGEAILAVALASACSWGAEQLFPVASLSVIYMTAVVVVASRRGWARRLQRRCWASWPTTFSSPIRAIPSTSAAG